MLEEGCWNSDVWENNKPMKNLLGINGNYPEWGTTFALQMQALGKHEDTGDTFWHSQAFCEHNSQILSSCSEQTQTHLTVGREEHGEGRSCPQISPKPGPHAVNMDRCDC